MFINKIGYSNNIYQLIPSFKGYYDRVKKLENDSSIFSSTYWNAEEIVARNMRSEINDLEKQISQKEAELRCRESVERDAKINHASILSSKRSQLSNIKRQISYNKSSALSDINRTLSQLGNQASQLSSANSCARNAISQQEANMTSLKNEIEDLKTKNREFQTSLKEDAEKRIKSISETYDKKLADIADCINESIRKPDDIIQDIVTPKPNGFGKISGFSNVKKAIIKAIGKTLAYEQKGKTVDVPNGILLFGPDTKNNEIFASIIPQQFDTNSIFITSDGDDVERFNRFKEATATAKNNFEKGQGRTLIIINDFDKFVPQGSRLIGPLKSLLDSLSKNAHATVIATTEFPELIDNILLRSGRFESKIEVPPMVECDILAVIKRYLPLELLDKVNLTSLMQLLDESQNAGAYSVERLVNFIKSLKNPENIRDLTTDIAPERIQMFKRQLEYIKHI